MLKVKFLLPLVVALLVGVFFQFGFFAEANSSSNIDVTEVALQGVLRMEIVEATKESPTYTKYFVQNFDGMNFRHTYLSQGKQGKIDFLPLVNKEVTFYGQGTEDLFYVSNVGKVVESPVENNVFAGGPFTLPPPTTGPRNVLTMLVNFASAPSTPYNQNQIKDWVYTGNNTKSARQFFEANSFNQFTLKGSNDPSGDVTPWLSLSASPTDCTTYMGNAWRIEADNMAEAQGFGKTSYQIRALLFAPIPGCNLTAAATVGSFGDRNGVTYVFMQLPSSGTQESLDGFSIALVHEIEHTLGQAAHSNGQQTEGGAIIDKKDDGDTLGSGKVIMNNVINRLRFGWIVIAQLYPTIQNRGQYRVFIQTPTINTRGIGPNSPPVAVIILLRDINGLLTGKALVIERRMNYGLFDQFGTDTQAYAKGASIRIVDLNLSLGSNSSVLQDATPTTSCCKDAPAVNGVSNWTSNLYGVTVSPDLPTIRGMWVNINLGNNYPQ